MFKIGDRVIYPMHGAGVVKDVVVKDIMGKKEEYLIIMMPIGNIKISVPVENAQNIGVRDVIDIQELKEVYDVLKGNKSKMSVNWNKKYRENLEKLKKGDVLEVAEVVRNLSIMDKNKGLSTGEKKMLNSAKKMLISEMVIVENDIYASVEKKIENAISYFEEGE